MNSIITLSDLLSKFAKEKPNSTAIIEADKSLFSKSLSYKKFTYSELNQESTNIAKGLYQKGVRKGMKAVLMVPPGKDFLAIIYALFKLGTILVLIDPGMGKKNVTSCINKVQPEVFIGSLKAQVIKKLLDLKHNSIKINLSTYTLPKSISNFFSLGFSLDSIKQIGEVSKKTEIFNQSKKEETAAIVFTSGSTGYPKGVPYSHSNFLASVEHVKKVYNVTSDEVELQTLPAFLIFDLASGVTTIIPKMDPRFPAKVNPLHIIEPIKKFKVTQMFGSPALLNQIGNYGKRHQITLPSLKRVISAGAPLHYDILTQFTSLLNKSTELHTPYGATEGFPLSTVSSKFLIKERGDNSSQDIGTCVGKFIEGVSGYIIKNTDEVLPNWSKKLNLGKNQPGEILVKGPMVTKSYWEDSVATEKSKIYDKESGEIYHRMGDIGYINEQGYLWLLGRKAHCIHQKNNTIYPLPIEGIFNKHPLIYRTALVAHSYREANGSDKITNNSNNPDSTPQTPILCIEIKKDITKEKSTLLDIKNELLELRHFSTLTKDIEHFVFIKSFPVDVRHNAKINREKLSKTLSDQDLDTIKNQIIYLPHVK